MGTPFYYICTSILHSTQWLIIGLNLTRHVSWYIFSSSSLCKITAHLKFIKLSCLWPTNWRFCWVWIMADFWVSANKEHTLTLHFILVCNYSIASSSAVSHFYIPSVDRDEWLGLRSWERGEELRSQFARLSAFILSKASHSQPHPVVYVCTYSSCCTTVAKLSTRKYRVCYCTWW